ncbi:TetR/AcrR family transcriptional regulator [Mesorhizobium terrae]
MAVRAEKMDANRKRILESALALFLERPFEDVTLQAIAEASGVSHQTVLNHFEFERRGRGRERRDPRPSYCRRSQQGGPEQHPKHH